MNQATQKVIELLGDPELDFGADPLQEEFLEDPEILRRGVERLVEDPPAFLAASDDLWRHLDEVDWAQVATVRWTATPPSDDMPLRTMKSSGGAGKRHWRCLWMGRRRCLVEISDDACRTIFVGGYPNEGVGAFQRTRVHRLGPLRRLDCSRWSIWKGDCFWRIVFSRSYKGCTAAIRDPRCAWLGTL